MFRSRSAFLPFAFCLLLSACSQAPVNSDGPGLEPQFGTPGADRADVVVMDAQRGPIYVAGITSADPLGQPDGGALYLRRYHQDGRLAWERRTRLDAVPGTSASANAVKLDAAGNVYLGWSRYFDDYEGRTPARDAYVSKLSPAGNLLYKLPVDNYVHDLEVDGAGNLYLASSSTNESPVGSGERFYLRKYGVQGKLVWERSRIYDSSGEQVENPTQAIPVPLDIGLGGDGSVYAVGVTGNCCAQDEDSPFWVLSKYSGAGRTLWQQPRPEAQGGAVLAAAGSSVYLLTNTTSQAWDDSTLVQRYSSSGSVLWQKTIAQSSAAALAVDAGDNLYLAGDTYQNANPASPDADLLVHKYTASGALAWTYTPRLAGTDESARGISAGDGGNVYLAGVTNGKVNGKNFGGDDAFLLRLDGRGKRVWSR